jgi:hypothetical protein
LSDVQCGGEGFLADDLGKTEISQLDRQILICEQDVLGLDVSVYNVALMLQVVREEAQEHLKTYQVLDRLEQLHKDLARLRLGQLLLHDDPVEELALSRQLEH